MPRETLPILYQDASLVAVHKPSGLLVHRSMIDRHATRFAVQIVRNQIGQAVFPVHRLDKGTSGILLFALSHSVAHTLSQQFTAQAIAKRYLAVVRGHPPEAGLIDYALSKTQDDYARPPKVGTRDRHLGETSLAERLSHPDEDLTTPCEVLPQAAQTRFQRLATCELPIAVERYPTSRYALLELEPLTGRRHQIRRHLKHIAHPIIGDATHGRGRHNRMFTEQFGSQRLLLACTEMRLTHPVTGQMLHLRAPLAEEFVELLEKLGWQAHAEGLRASSLGSRNARPSQA